MTELRQSERCAPPKTPITGTIGGRFPLYCLRSINPRAIFGLGPSDYRRKREQCCKMAKLRQQARSRGPSWGCQWIAVARIIPISAKPPDWSGFGISEPDSGVLVPVKGLEPSRGVAPADFESAASTIPPHRPAAFRVSAALGVVNGDPCAAITVLRVDVGGAAWPKASKE